MRSYAINSFIYMQLLEKELSVLYELKLSEFRMLCIIDSEQELNKSKYCTVSNILEYSQGVNIDKETLFKNVKNLINKGYLENLGQRKYKLIITGKGDYLIREVIKSLHRKIITKEGEKRKRLKYSFIDKTY